jgi:hypothetical protein
MPTPSRCGFRCTLCLVGAFLAAGCGGEKLVKVSGTALRHGKPVPHLVINFSPEKGLRSFALTDQDGKFNMLYTNGQEGVVVGTHKVWVQQQTAGSKEDKDYQKRLAMQRNDPEIAQILRKYGKAETTPLIIEAKEDKERDLNLD